MNYLDELESDFSAIHRIDDIYAMDSRTFFRLSCHLPAYKGAIRSRIEYEQENDKPARHRGEEVTQVSPDQLLALYDNEPPPPGSN